MDFKDWTEKVRRQLGGLGVSQKLLIGTLMAFVPMALWLVARYAGAPDMTPVLDQTMDSASQTRIVEYLRSTGVPYRVDNGAIEVPEERRLEVVAALSLQKLLPEDTSQGLAAYVREQTWWTSNTQNQQLFNIALQNEISRVISAYPWVERATVLISRPQRQGLGKNFTRPTASVNVVVGGGDRLDQHKVDAIAGFVAGSVSGMRAEDVSVVDALAGRPWKVRDGESLDSGDLLEAVAKHERRFYEKIAGTLRYIDNVIVAVNVEVDMTRQQTDSKSVQADDPKTLVSREFLQSTENRQAAAGGEPGVRSNTSLDIAGATPVGTSSTSEQNETEFIPTPFYTHTQASIPAGSPKRVSATVNVPRSYFVNIYKQGRPEDAAEPTDQDLAPVIQENLERIKKLVEPLVLVNNQAGQVVVDTYADGAMTASVADQTGGGPMGWLALIEKTWPTAALVGLALASLAMMLVMVRRASARPELPSAAHLAGLPEGAAPGAAAAAGGGFDALEGIEMDEDAMRLEQMVRQVGEVVDESPADTATLLKWWMHQNSE